LVMTTLFRKVGRASGGSIRQYTVDVVCRRLGYSEYGDPTKVVQLLEEPLRCELASGQVLAKYLECPVNPADINVVQGTYPLRPPLPATVGGEGVAEIVATGPGCSLQPGSWVLPNIPMTGTWRSHVVNHEDAWLPIRNDIPVTVAATIMINPCTAYRMLLDFVDLAPGDWVVQNGANSAVGQAVIQIAKTMGVKTANVVRDREDMAGLRSQLESMGADLVLTEEEMRATKVWKSGELPKPKLGLNCVGGASGLELCKALADRGVHVTYGGMSRKPVTAATSHMIFKDLELRGFWMGQWNQRQGMSEARVSMMEALGQLAKDGSLLAPTHKHIGFSDYKEALGKSLAGFLPAKYIFKVDQ